MSLEMLQLRQAVLHAHQLVVKACLVLTVLTILHSRVGGMQLGVDVGLWGFMNVSVFLFFLILSYNPYASLRVMVVECCCSAAVLAL